MKIALLSFEYPPETGFGGIGTYTWYQARALVKLGHEVHVLAGSSELMPLTTCSHDGVYVHRYRAAGFLMRLFRQVGRLGCHWSQRRLENAWCMYRALKILMRAHRFDVLEMPECGAEGCLINWLIAIPAVVRFHSPAQLIMGFYGVSRADLLLCSLLEWLALPRAAALTSCSAFLAGEVRSRMGAGNRVRVIPNGIDLSCFDGGPVADIASKYDFPAGRVTVLFAGRMERRKGIHLCGAIAQSILERHDVVFIFAGEDLFGYMENSLLPSLRDRPLLGSVCYVNKLPLDELRACMRAVDILILPSLWENCPYSCMEAMAAGRAIVCSDQGGMPEMIQHGVNGLLARPEDAASFIAQLDTLITDSVMRRRLGAAARQTVESRYSDVRIARLSEEVYAECALVCD